MQLRRIKRNVDVLTKKLSYELSCFDHDCYFELDRAYDEESEVMLSVIIYYPASKWLEDEQDQEMIMDEYTIKISKIYKKIVES